MTPTSASTTSADNNKERAYTCMRVLYLISLFSFVVPHERRLLCSFIVRHFMPLCSVRGGIPPPTPFISPDFIRPLFSARVVSLAFLSLSTIYDRVAVYGIWDFYKIHRKIFHFLAYLKKKQYLCSQKLQRHERTISDSYMRSRQLSGRQRLVRAD